MGLGLISAADLAAVEGQLAVLRLAACAAHLSQRICRDRDQRDFVGLPIDDAPRRDLVGAAADLLDAVNVASVAIIVAVSFDMAKASVNDWRTILIAFAGLLLTFRYPRINSAWIVLGGAAAGFLLYLI